MTASQREAEEMLEAMEKADEHIARVSVDVLDRAARALKHAGYPGLAVALEDVAEQLAAARRALSRGPRT